MPIEAILIGGIVLVAVIILVIIIVGGIKSARKGNKELNDNPNAVKETSVVEEVMLWLSGLKETDSKKEDSVE